MAQTESWRKVPEAPMYEVSSGGSVRRAVNRCSSHKHRNRPWAYLKPERARDGHLRVNVDGVRWFIHRLVYREFVGALIPGLVVCHRDGDPANNDHANLLQAPQKVNMQHKRLHGTSQRGHRHPLAKHSDEDALAVLRALQNARYTATGRLGRGELRRVSDEVGVSYHFASDVRAGKSWGHVRC